MHERRRKARDYLKSINTVNEFEEYIDSLTISNEQKSIVKDIYIHGLSHTQIAIKYNISVEKSHKIIQKVLDKVL